MMVKYNQPPLNLPRKGRLFFSPLHISPPEGETFEPLLVSPSASGGEGWEGLFKKSLNPSA